MYIGLITKQKLISKFMLQISTSIQPGSKKRYQIESNLLMQKGQLATNNAKNQDNIKVLKQFCNPTKLNTSSVQNT